MGVGMPTALLLQEFGERVYQAFGHMSYHVGSSLTEKIGWRDVDVRLILPDEEYERMELGDPDRPHINRRWCSLVRAWSTFGQVLTGLPIDFQIQQRSYANAKFSGKRSALFCVYEAVEAAPRSEGETPDSCPHCGSRNVHLMELEPRVVQCGDCLRSIKMPAPPRKAGA